MTHTRGVNSLCRGVAIIETTEATASVTYSISCNSLDFPNSYYQEIDMLEIQPLLRYKIHPGYTHALDSRP